MEVKFLRLMNLLRVCTKTIQKANEEQKERERALGKKIGNQEQCLV